MYEEIKDILTANQLEYTDTQISNFISEAKRLLDIDLLTPHQETDYNPEFIGQKYLTKFYPLLNTSIILTVNSNRVTPKYVERNSGIIHLPMQYMGELQCTYTVGLSESDVLTSITPLVVALICDKEGLNYNSITEGDVSVSRSGGKGSGDVTSIDGIIRDIRGRYDCMVRLI